MTYSPFFVAWPPAGSIDMDFSVDSGRLLYTAKTAVGGQVVSQNPVHITVGALTNVAKLVAS